MKINEIRDVIWAEINASGQTIHHTAKCAGISHVTLRRFLWDEGGMTIHSMMMMLDSLGLEISIKKKMDGEGTNA